MREAKWEIFEIKNVLRFYVKACTLIVWQLPMKVECALTTYRVSFTFVLVRFRPKIKSCNWLSLA